MDKHLAQIKPCNKPTESEIWKSIEGFVPNLPQILAQRFFNKHTDMDKILLNLDPGMGKTMTSLLLALNKFSSGNYRQIVILSFHEDVFYDELLFKEYLGMVTKTKRAYYENLKATDPEMYSKQRGLFKKEVHKTFTFMGYGSFFNKTLLGYGDSIEPDTNEILNKIETGEYRVNNMFLRTMEDTIFVCDECHVLYNSEETNTHGAGILIADRFLKNKAFIFMTATLFNSSPSELAALANLLKDHKELFSRSDFFKGHEVRDGVSLKPLYSAIKGKIYYDVVDKHYFPPLKFHGKKIKGIPYFKFVTVKMSDEHKKAYLDAGITTKNNDDILDDLVFPQGVYKSEHFRNIKQSDYFRSTFSKHGSYFTGNFLKKENIYLYSGKMAKVLDIMDNYLTENPSKGLIYHSRIGGSGILQMTEFFKYNGYVLDGESPTEDTFSSLTHLTYKQSHENFIPSKFNVVHNFISKPQRQKIYDKFNSRDNLNGKNLQFLIGSNVMLQSIDFNHVRWMIVPCRASSVPKFIQLFGRVSRYQSHKLFSNPGVDVFIVVYEDDDFETYELSMYRRKAELYQEMQVIEKEIHKDAINNIVYTPNPSEGIFRQLDYPNTPLKYNGDDTIYISDEYVDQEYQEIKKKVRNLFISTPIWTKESLWSKIKNPPLKSIVDHQYSKSVFEMVMSDLCYPGDLYILENSDKIIQETYYSGKTIKTMKKIIVEYKDKSENYYILMPFENNKISTVPDAFLKTVDHKKMLHYNILNQNSSNLNKKIFKEYLKDKSEDKHIEYFYQNSVEFHEYVMSNYLMGKLKRVPLMLIYEKLGILGPNYYKSLNNINYWNGFEWKKDSKAVPYFTGKNSFILWLNNNDIKLISEEYPKGNSIFSFKKRQIIKYLNDMNIEFDENKIVKDLIYVLFKNIIKLESKSRRDKGIKYLYTFEEYRD